MTDEKAAAKAERDAHATDGPDPRDVAADADLADPALTEENEEPSA